MTELEVYRAGDLLIDVAAARVMRNGCEIALPKLSFDLLVALVRTAPAVSGHDALLETVWPEVAVGEETVKQRVRLLRKALDDDSRQPRYIGAKRGLGYVLIPSVERLSERPLEAHLRPRKKGGWRVLLTVAVLAAACLTAHTLWWPWQSQELATSDRTNAIRSETAADEMVRRARTYYHRYSAEDNTIAIQLLKQAVELAPGNAAAFALLSRAYSQQPKLGAGSFHDEAQAAAEQAIKLAPQRPEGYVAKGLAFDVSGRPQAGLRAYQLALERDPHAYDAVANTACNLMVLGRLDEALAWNIRSMEMNPDVHFGMIQMADTLDLLGYADRAEAWYQKVLQLQPDHIFGHSGYAHFLLKHGRYEAVQGMLEKGDWQPGTQAKLLGDLLFWQGDLKGAAAAFASAGDHDYAQYRLGLVLHLDGRRDEAAPLLEAARFETSAAIAAGNESASLRYIMATLVLAENRRDEAISWLHTAVDAGWSDLAWLEKDPPLTALAEDHAFLTLLDELRTRRNEQRDRIASQQLLH